MADDPNGAIIVATRAGDDKAVVLIFDDCEIHNRRQIGVRCDDFEGLGRRRLVFVNLHKGFLLRFCGSGRSGQSDLEQLGIAIM